MPKLEIKEEWGDAVAHMVWNCYKDGSLMTVSCDKERAQEWLIKMSEHYNCNDGGGQ